ncbi:MAG: PilZ domain-containing protein [Acidobacteriota bacterium]
MNDEKRTGERVPVNLPTRWHSATGTYEGRVEDVSVTGCFVNTKGAVDVGEIVSLLIQLPSGRWLPLRGKVAFYQQLTGFSISFSILDDKERETLHELVAQQSQTS